MFWVILTATCYIISSLGDKYISSDLDYTPSEFSFLVSAIILQTATHFRLAFFFCPSYFLPGLH